MELLKTLKEKIATKEIAKTTAEQIESGMIWCKENKRFLEFAIPITSFILFDLFVTKMKYLHLEKRPMNINVYISQK